MNTKPFFASKTVWLNLIAGIIAIITPLMSDKFIENNPKAVLAFSVVVAILNLLLRTFSTAQPIAPPSAGAGTGVYALLGVLFFVGLAGTAAAAPTLEDFRPKVWAVTFDPANQVTFGQPVADFKVAAQATTPPANPQYWTGSLLLTRHDAWIVVGKPIGQSTHVFGLKNVTVFLSADAGYAYRSSTPGAGGDGSVHVGISDNDSLAFGLGFMSGMRNNRTFFNPGIGVSLTHRF